jgi:predicted nucleic acid-binding Zn ribbon protein
LGVAVGAGIGAGLEKKARQEGRIRELTPVERRRQRRTAWLGVAILLLGVAVMLAILLL